MAVLKRDADSSDPDNTLMCTAIVSMSDVVRLLRNYLGRGGAVDLARPTHASPQPHSAPVQTRPRKGCLSYLMEGGPADVVRLVFSYLGRRLVQHFPAPTPTPTLVWL